MSGGEFSFPPSRRLRKGAEFARAYRHRLRVADNLLIVLAYPNGRSYHRLGLSVSRKVGNSVVRHRWKRLIREAFRLSQCELATAGAALDFVVLPQRNKALPISMAAVQRSLVALIQQAENKTASRR